jgi:hypothetical protein
MEESKKSSKQITSEQKMEKLFMDSKLDLKKDRSKYNRRIVFVGIAVIVFYYLPRMIDHKTRAQKLVRAAAKIEINLKKINFISSQLNEVNMHFKNSDVRAYESEKMKKDFILAGANIKKILNKQSIQLIYRSLYADKTYALYQLKRDGLVLKPIGIELKTHHFFNMRSTIWLEKNIVNILVFKESK